MSEDLLREFVASSLDQHILAEKSRFSKTVAAYKRGKASGEKFFAGDILGAIEAIIPPEMKDNVDKILHGKHSEEGIRITRKQIDTQIDELQAIVLKKRGEVEKADEKEQAKLEAEIEALMGLITQLEDKKDDLVVSGQRRKGQKLVDRIARDILGSNFKRETSSIRIALKTHHRVLGVSNDAKGLLDALELDPSNDLKDFYVDVAKGYDGLQKLQIQRNDLSDIHDMLASAIAKSRARL